MPIKYVKGDLFSTDIRCIAHGCNTAGVMGSGVAAVVKKKFPHTFHEYAKECFLHKENPNSLLGQTVMTTEDDGLQIFNMFTQGDWSRAFGTDKRYASYDAIQECFEHANDVISQYGESDRRLAIPMIGAGFGGGDWDIIEKIIEKSCPDIEVVVYQL